MQQRSLVPANTYVPARPRGSIAIRNPWNNTFSIPVRVGRSSLEPCEQRAKWYSRDPIRLIDQTKPAECAGLTWDIRVQGDHDGYVLYVIPLRGDTHLPNGYLLQYKVTVRVDSENIPPNSRLSAPHSWEQEVERLPEDFETGFSRIKGARLPYDFDDFLHYHSCTYEDSERVLCFRLNIQIQVTYEKLRHVVTRHTGLIGAILSQYEKNWEERETKIDILQDEATRTNAEHYREVHDLKNELEMLRDKNMGLQAQVSQMAFDHKREYSLLAERHERNIKNLTDSIQTMTEDRQAQDRRLDEQQRLVNNQMGELQSFGDKIAGLSEEICSLRLSNGPIVDSPRAKPSNWGNVISDLGQAGRNSSMASSRMENAFEVDSPNRSRDFGLDSFPSQIDISYQRSDSQPSAPLESEIPSAPKEEELPSAPPAPQFSFSSFTKTSPPTPPRQPQRNVAIENPAEENEEEDGVYTFQPIVTLREQRVESGHEHETLVFERQAKVYRFVVDAKEWKERGDGPLQIYHNNEQGSYHLVVRQNLTNKARLNQAVSSRSLEATERATGVITWHGTDWSGINEDEESTTTSFCARFKSEQAANDFMSVFNSIVQNNPGKRSNVPVTIEEEMVDLSKDEDEEKANAMPASSAPRFATPPTTSKFAFSLEREKKDDDNQFSFTSAPTSFGGFPTGNSESTGFGFGSSMFGAKDTSEDAPAGNGFSFPSSFGNASSKPQEEKAEAPAFGSFGQPAPIGTFNFGNLSSDAPVAAPASGTAFSFGNTFGDSTPFSFGNFGNSGDIAAPAAETVPAALPDNDVGSSWNAIAPQHAGGEEPEDDVVVTFQPIVQLEEIEVKTGEEDCETLFESRGKLYRWAMDIKQWKERAIGSVKILKDPDGSQRLVVRQEKTLRIRARHPVPYDAELSTIGENRKTVVWGAVDYSRDDADDEPAYHKFCVRFKDEPTADKFRSMFQKPHGFNSEPPTSLTQPPPPALEKASPEPPKTKPKRKVIRAMRSNRGPKETEKSASANSSPDKKAQTDAKEPSEEVAKPGSKQDIKNRFFAAPSDDSAANTTFSFGNNDQFGFQTTDPNTHDLQSFDFTGKKLGDGLGSVNVSFGGSKFTNDDDTNKPPEESEAKTMPSFGSFSSTSTYPSFSSFGGSTTNQFSFGNLSSAPVAPAASEGTSNQPANDDDNGEYTLQPIVHLNELDDVPTGHEDEDIVFECPIKKAYRYMDQWKIRAEKTNITIWKNRSSNKYRIVVREGETSKLRLNHFIPSAEVGEISVRRGDDAVAVWRAVDFSDPEDHDGSGDMRMFCVRFNDGSDCARFVEEFKKGVPSETPTMTIPPANFGSPPKKEEKPQSSFTPSTFKSASTSPFGSFSFNAPKPKKQDERPKSAEKAPSGGFSSFATGNPTGFGNTDKTSAPPGGFAALAANSSGWGDEPKRSSGGFGSFENFSFSDSSLAGKKSGGGFGGFEFSKSPGTGFGSPPKEQPVGEGANGNADDDNCVEYTLKPLVSLDETSVPTGHENEKLLLSVANVKLYRYTDGIEGGRQWKIRGKGALQIYQMKTDASKTRIVMREHITEKVRINAFISIDSQMSLKNGNPATRVWTALDYSGVGGDEQDEHPTFFQFCARFPEVSQAEEFQKIYETAQAQAEA